MCLVLLTTSLVQHSHGYGMDSELGSDILPLTPTTLVIKNQI